MSSVKLNLVQTSFATALGQSLLAAVIVLALTYLLWTLFSKPKDDGSHQPSFKGAVVIFVLLLIAVGISIYGRITDDATKKESVTQALVQISDTAKVKFINPSEVTYANLASHGHETAISFTKDGKFQRGTLVSNREGIALLVNGSTVTSPENALAVESSAQGDQTNAKDEELSTGHHMRSSSFQPVDVLVKDGFIWGPISANKDMQRNAEAQIEQRLAKAPKSLAPARYSQGTVPSDVTDSLERLSREGKLAERVVRTQP